MHDIKVSWIDYTHCGVECSDSIHYELRDYFSFEAEGAKFDKRVKYGSWDGRIRLYQFGRLPLGLLKTLGLFAKQMSYSIHVDPRLLEKEDVTKEAINEWIDKLEVYSGSDRINPYWYQREAVFQGIHNQRRMLVLPTSAGKSLIATLLSRWYLEHYTGKVLVIVPTTSLVLQMRDDAVDYRLLPYEAIETIMSGSKSKQWGNTLMTVSTWQSACKKPVEWFQQFGMVIVDECHKATAKNITKIVEGMNHCRFKIGMTGSPRESKAHLMSYVGMFGDISKIVSIDQLMEEGQVTKLKINCLFLRYTDEECAAVKGRDYAEEIKYITANPRRNKFVCNLALKLAQKGENVFLMFRSKKHGKMLCEALQKVHDKVYYIDGDVKTDDRDTFKKLAEGETGLICVASYGVFSTGVSIKNLHHVIFGHPVKESTLVRQSIGRTLRKHGSKDIATVWDVVDHLAVKTKSKNAKKQFSHLNYALKHALERIKIYVSDKFDWTQKTISLA
ncbi:DEAD/DEAH box helicase [Salmonella enterica subsp. enterica serovar Berkeley]|nr:DEAD/DEAH box helicase [Salmonella enterica subsp. enterica serovar Berkeley]